MTKIKKSLLTSWQTTVAGIIQFVTIAGPQIMTLLDSNPLTNPDYNILIASFMTLVGLSVARDNNVSSETAGAE